MMRSSAFTLCLLLAFAGAREAGAQDSPGADIQAIADALASPETTDKLASFYWNLYQALLAKGFTQDQAVELAASLGWPFPAHR
ncbi:MAG: hypothetical protein EXQ94_15010 [Alphaproteobacteria bacterium]|nr:hypothetical protein [Alphaproteobacteria bacterium]